MTLRECYAEHSYYYLKLECEMKRIIRHNSSNGHAGKIIAAFCSGALGNLLLASTEDYKNVLDVFQHFVAGAEWAFTSSIGFSQKA